ncbi:MAG: DUF523 domain-containing protein [Methanoculleus sp.]
MRRETVLVSLCALGVPCRYHGKTHMMGQELYRRKRIESLMRRYEVLPLCGEILGGLPTPRPPCEVVVEEDGATVVRERGGSRVFTREYFRGARQVVRLCDIYGVRKAYLQKGSPMCGPGYGILAGMLEARGVTVRAL